jgi:hypothetical protein
VRILRILRYFRAATGSATFCVFIGYLTGYRIGYPSGYRFGYLTGYRSGYFAFVFCL